MDEYDFHQVSVVSTLKRRSAVAWTEKPTMVKLQIIQNEGTKRHRAPVQRLTYIKKKTKKQNESYQRLKNVLGVASV